MIDNYNKEYWEKILGKTILQSVDWTMLDTIREAAKEKNYLCDMYEIWNSEIQMTAWKGEIECFGSFYRWFIYIGEIYSQKKYPLLYEACTKSCDVR